MSTGKLYFVSAEPSGDIFAVEIMNAMRNIQGDINIRATGGPALKGQCDVSGIDVSALNVLGLWEGVKAFGDVRRISSAIASDIVEQTPDAVVLVDSWGLSLRVAQKVRARNPDIKLIKLIGPQVWASRPGRAKTLAGAVDHLLCIHAFEEPFYKPFNLKTTIIGQPALARSQRLNGATFRNTHNIDDNRNILLVLPGSRPAEIERVGPPLIEAAHKLAKALPDLKIIIAPALSVLPQFKTAFPDLPESWTLLEDETQRYEAMAAATLALSCSGTVNTELAVQGTPFITGYRIGSVSWVLLKNFLMTAKYITLLNMAADEMVVPEFLQNAFSGSALAKVAAGLLDNPEALERQKDAQDAALLKMGYGDEPAASIAAKAILADLA